jgi:ribokinase
LAVASPGDILVMQNETNGQLRAAKIAKKMGLNVVYAAAPFEAEAITSVLPYTDLLVLNSVEASQLKAVLGRSLKDLGVHNIVVTQGADGSCWIDALAKLETQIPAISVASVDTTGAGDTFTGFLVAGLDRGLPMMQSLNLATQAAALMVARFGTADVIPDLKEIEEARLG